jgi:hypothetical protein
MDLCHSAEELLTEMNDTVIDGPWLVAQLVRVRTLEAEVRKLLATSQPSGALLRQDRRRTRLAISAKLRSFLHPRATPDGKSHQAL